MSDHKPHRSHPRLPSAKAIDHIVIKVADVYRSEAFYSKYLGARAEMRDEFLSGERGFLSMRIGDALIDLVPAEDPGSVGPKGVAHICLVVEGTDPVEARKAFEDDGVLVESAVSFDRLGAHGAGPSFYITDPDGYRIELKWYEN